MNIVDSSAWLEYFASTQNARNYSKVIENPSKLIVPTITIFEVFKKVLSEKGENIALQVIAHMKLGKVVDFDMDIALYSALICKEYKLPMADGIIYATAKVYNAVLWTQDSDFKNIDGVKYFTKK